MKTPTATRPTEGDYLYRLAYAAIQQAQGRYYTHNPREAHGELEEAMDEVIVDMAQQVKTRRLKGIPK